MTGGATLSSSYKEILENKSTTAEKESTAIMITATTESLVQGDLARNISIPVAVLTFVIIGVIVGVILMRRSKKR